MTKQTREPNVQTGVDLLQLNTFGLSSVAPLFCEVKTVDQLLLLSKRGFFDHEMPFVLGGGSNVLLSETLSLPVLRIGFKGIEVIESDQKSVRVEVQAGEEWHNVVRWAVENQFGGLENLALIPGTAGAAPIQNIGAYGVELKERMEAIRWMDFEGFKQHIFTPDECNFGYRDSIFKNELKGRGVVRSIIMKLTRDEHQLRMDYGSLREVISAHEVENPTIKSVFDAVVAVRQSKLPDPAEIGNAGSFFKNPVISLSQFEELKKNYKNLPGFPDKEGWIKVPAGWLIEAAGWKGKRVGKAGIWHQQALVIVNLGGATASDISSLADSVKEDVYKEFGILLTPEVTLIQ